MGIFDSFSMDIGIDLGTCNTLIYVRNKGIVINQPSVLAVQRGNGQIVAVGEEAKDMLGKTPQNIEASCPLKDGVISDIDATEKMMKYFISKILKHPWLLKPRMRIGIPSCITEVERRAVEEAAMRAGARSVDIITESLAAAIGANIPINEPIGHMVCDIGGGTTEVSVISMGDMVVTHAIRIGGNEFDEAIVKYINVTHNLNIGTQTAEAIKIGIGNAMPEKSLGMMEVKGIGTRDGLPHKIEIDSVEVCEALKDPVNRIIEVIKQTLSDTPYELAADITECGIVMTGGGSLLKGLDQLVRQETGVPALLAENPLDCVAIGAGKSFEVFKNRDVGRKIYDSLNS